MVGVAGMSGLWSLFMIVFIVGPVVRWGVGWSVGRRRRWRMDRWDWDPDRGAGREVAELRSELEGRLADIETLNQRVAELENRVDFAERLLATQRDPALLSTPSTPS